MRILVIHGPNLQLLGSREQRWYGRVTLNQINDLLRREARQAKASLEILQSNHEGEIVEAIGSARKRGIRAIVINPAAYTHTSVAIRDALAASGLPAVEVHLSNIYAREEFRQKSLVAPVVQGQIAGLGIESYRLGLLAAITLARATGGKRKV